jgi:hypothetical protein
MTKKPLSESLAELLVARADGERLVVNDLLERTGGRGLYLIMVLLCLPFVAPLPIFGVSLPLGTILLFLSGRLALGLPPSLPGGIGKLRIPAIAIPRLAGGGVRTLRWVEKWVKPRGSEWMEWRAVRCFNASLIAWMAFLLALPLPVPASNMLPAQAIVILTACMMEDDGRVIWFGYFYTALTTAYFALWGVAFFFFPRHYKEMLHWF